MSNKHKKKVIGIILAYNCEKLLKSTFDQLPKNTFDLVIVVDDGSTDKTIEFSKKLGFQTFSHKHLGYGGNLKYGLKKAYEMGGDYMVEIHGDGQFDPSAAPYALNKINEGYDLLFGSRFIDIRQPLKDKMPLSRYIMNIVTSFIARIVLRVNLTEVHNGFHIFSREFISTAGFAGTSLGHIYSFEIIVQARFNKLKICEVPVRCNYKEMHTSMDILESIPYILQIFYTLGQYLLAKMGFKYGIFKSY